MSRWKRRRQRQQRTTNPTPTSGDFFVSEVRTFCMSVDRLVIMNDRSERLLLLDACRDPLRVMSVKGASISKRLSFW